MSLLSPLSIRRRALSLMACMLKGRRRRSAQQYALGQAAEIMECRVLLTDFTASPVDFPNQNVSNQFSHVTLATAAGFSGNSPVYTAASSRQGPIQIFSPNSSAGGQTAGAFGSSNRLRLTFDRGVSDFEIVGYSGPAGSMVVGYFRSDMSLIEKHTISIERLVPGFDSFHRDAADIRYVFAEANNINSFSYTLDDTPLPSSLSISAANANRNEGNSGSTPFTFTVTRSGDTSGATSASYEVAGSGTHPANAFDFTGATLPSGTVNFAAGQISKTITVNVNGDGLTESNEDFTVTLSNATGGATIDTSVASGTIVNDDSSPAATVSISVSPASVAENGTANLVYTFRRTGSTANDLSVFFTIDGSAFAPDDYTIRGEQLFGSTIRIPAGASSATLTVDPTPDTVLEPDETVILALAESSDYVIGSSSSATGTILADPPIADLWASDLGIPDSGAANTTISVDAEVTNEGTKASGSFDVKFYLSADDQITASDLLLATVTRNSIAVGDYQDWTQLLSLPKTVTEGDYWIGMIVDPALKITESDETNNTIASGPIPISGPPRPDLAVSDFQIPYAFGAATGTVSVNAVVDNPTLVASGNFDVKFYLSTDEEFTASDSLLTTVNRNSIVAGGHQSWTQSLTLPKTLAAGDYFIGVVLDPANKIIETDESNNIGSISVTVAPGTPRPDLVANNLVIPDSGAANTNLSVGAEVANLGTKESGKFDVKFYLSTDDQITASDRLLTTVTRNTLLPGGLQTWTQLLSLPKTVTAGDYYVGMILDPALKIAESDETNNIFIAGSIPISGPPRPDLVVSDFQIAYALGAAAGTVSVNAVVDNPGLVPSGSFDVKYYLSTDGDITTSDTLLTTVTRNSIASRGNQGWTQSLTLPKNLAAGDYSIGMILDPANKIIETDETNNIGSASLTVVPGAPRPDLVVNNLVIPDSGAANTTISVAAEVANLGTKESGKFDIKFYLSFDDQITVGDMLLTTVTRNTILPGGIQNWTQLLNLPRTVTEGDYYIGMIIDPAFKVAESDENNNAFGQGPIRISGPPRPDLSGNLTIPASATAGNTIAARIAIDNLSPTASGKFDGLFYLSDDDVITPDDLFVVAVFDRSSIAANGRQTWTQSFTLPNTLADGNYWLGFVIDAGEKIAESDETNNIVVGGPTTISAIPLPVSVPTDDRLGNDRFDFAVGYPIVVTQPFQFSIRGHVGPGTQFGDDDGLDRFSFSFQRASTIRIELTNLSVNAGMLLDSLTPGVADKSSNNSGLTSEIITQSFPAGGTADLLINASTLGAFLPFGATTYTLTITVT